MFKKIFISILFLVINNLWANTLLNSDVIWKNQDNKEVKLTSFIGKMTAVTMFYTECKKTCPLVTMAKLREINEYYAKKNQNIEFILVSFDPESDTPEILHQFQDKNELDSAKWHLLVGNKETTRALAKELGMGEYWKMDDHILHGFKIMIFNDKGELDHTLDWDHKDVAEILK